MSHRRRTVAIILAFLLLVVTLGLFTQQAQAQSTDNKKVSIYLFWGEGCPHCAALKPVLEDLAKRYPQVELRMYEIYGSKENLELMEKIALSYGFEPKSVPTTFIGQKYWVGYSENVKKEIEETVKGCIASGACPDAGKGIVPGSAVQGNQDGVIDIPLLGKIDLNKQSLAVSTLLIAFVDGFNPCSIWVLTMLLALTIHTGSRRKILLIGLIFLTITAAIYALFILGLFSILTVVSFVGWIQVAVALVSLFFAIINIKDYFWYKKGVSFTIADDKKPGIFQKMRRVLDSSQSLWGLISATVVLAAGVSLVEFSCTAGFPVLWTNLVSSQKVDGLTFGMLLLVYMLIYQLDEIVIFLVAVFTLRASKLEEKEGRILKLVGGMLMLTLAVVMIFNPSLMNQLSSALVIFAVAFGLVLLVLLLHRRILPAFGIYIGTELGPKGKTRRRHAGK